MIFRAHLNHLKDPIMTKFPAAPFLGFLDRLTVFCFFLENVHPKNLFFGARSP